MHVIMVCSIIFKSHQDQFELLGNLVSRARKYLISSHHYYHLEPEVFLTKRPHFVDARAVGAATGECGVCAVLVSLAFWLIRTMRECREQNR